MQDSLKHLQLSYTFFQQFTPWHFICFYLPWFSTQNISLAHCTPSPMCFQRSVRVRLCFLQCLCPNPAALLSTSSHPHTSTGSSWLSLGTPPAYRSRALNALPPSLIRCSCWSAEHGSARLLLSPARENTPRENTSCRHYSTAPTCLLIMQKFPALPSIR